MIKFGRLARQSAEADMDFLVRMVTFVRQNVVSPKQIIHMSETAGLLYIWWDDATGDTPPPPGGGGGGIPGNPNPQFPFPLPTTGLGEALEKCLESVPGHTAELSHEGGARLLTT